MVTMQVGAVPLHAPPHALNTEPGAALALSATRVFTSYAVRQPAPQLILPSADVTAPSPAVITASEYSGTKPVICASSVMRVPVLLKLSATARKVTGRTEVTVNLQ